MVFNIDDITLRTLDFPPYTTKNASLTWSEEDLNFIIIGETLRSIMSMPDSSGFEPYDPVTTYTASPPSYVSYSNNIWQYISPINQSGITPGSDDSVWQIVSLGQFTHEKNKDTYLDFGGTNQLSALEIKTFINSNLYVKTTDGFVMAGPFGQYVYAPATDDKEYITLRYFNENSAPGITYSPGVGFEFSGSPATEIDFDTNYIDPSIRSLIDSSNNVSADWDNNFLAVGGNARVHWGNQTLYDASNKFSARWGIRKLYWTDGSTVVGDWDLGKFYDSSGNASFDIFNRYVYDSSGTTVSISGNDRELRNSSGDSTILWDLGLTRDVSGNGSLDWFNRKLYKSGGLIAIQDWELGDFFALDGSASMNTNDRVLYHDTSDPSLDYFNKVGYYNGGPGSLVSFDYGQGFLYDSTGGDSATWNDRELRVTAGYTALKWLSTGVKVTHLGGLSASPGIAAGAGAGTSPTVSLGGNSTDIAGVVNVTTGTLPTGTNATVVTITFDAAYATAPTIVLFPANAITAALSGVTMVYTGSNTTTFTVTSGTTALTGATAYSWYYQVIQ